MTYKQIFQLITSGNVRFISQNGYVQVNEDGCWTYFGDFGNQIRSAVIGKDDKQRNHFLAWVISVLTIKQEPSGVQGEPGTNNETR